MAEAASTGKSGKVVIRNIGLLLSGDIDKPILDADTIVVNDGLIVAVGKLKDCDVEHAQTVIDAHQTCVCPGLIDSHVHPVFGDWTPRQNQIGWIDSTMPFSITGAPARTFTPPGLKLSNARCAVMASALSPTMSLGRPGR